jgi:hypothetical protein
MFPRVNNLLAVAFAILLSCSLVSAQPAYAPKVIIDTDFNTIFDNGQEVVMVAQDAVKAVPRNANAVEATITANHGSDAVLDEQHGPHGDRNTALRLPSPATAGRGPRGNLDAVNSIIGDYQPYVAKVSAPPGASAAAAAAQAGHDVLVVVMPPAVKSQLDSALQASLAQLPNDQHTQDGVTVGKSVASRLLALRSGDGPFLDPLFPFIQPPVAWRMGPRLSAVLWCSLPRANAAFYNEVYLAIPSGPPPALISPTLGTS